MSDQPTHAELYSKVAVVEERLNNHIQTQDEGMRRIEHKLHEISVSAKANADILSRQKGVIATVSAVFAGIWSIVLAGAAAFVSRVVDGGA